MVSTCSESRASSFNHRPHLSRVNWDYKPRSIWLKRVFRFHTHARLRADHPIRKIRSNQRLWFSRGARRSGNWGSVETELVSRDRFTLLPPFPLLWFKQLVSSACSHSLERPSLQHYLSFPLSAVCCPTRLTVYLFKTHSRSETALVSLESREGGAGSDFNRSWKCNSVLRLSVFSGKPCLWW